MEFSDQKPMEEDIGQKAEAIEQEPSDEAIQQGLIYPPPPSYYQNMQVPPVHPPLPGRPLVEREVIPNRYGYIPPAQQVYPARLQAPAVPYAPPGFSPSQPPARQPNKWVWILIGVLGLSFLLSCGLCSWAVLAVSTTVTQRVAAATNVVNDYYGNISKQNYTAAYSHLAPLSNGPTLEQFITQAKNSDRQNGAVIFYSAEPPSLNTDPTSSAILSTLSFTVAVTRAKLNVRQNYTVQLTVSKIGGDWKITNYSGI